MIAVFALVAFLVGCDGPFLVIPGGKLSGELATTPVEDWSFLDAQFVHLETNPDDPYSVELNYIVRDGKLYIDPAEGKRWYDELKKNLDVRVKFGDVIYPVRAVLVGEPGELPGFDADRYIYRLDYRTEEGRQDDRSAAVLDEIRGHGATNVLFWSRDQRRVAFGNIKEILPTRKVNAGTDTYELSPPSEALSSLSYEVQGVEHSLSDFLSREGAMGLIVVRGNDILFEHYAEGHNENRPWVSFSVTKSITSMLIGAAIQDGFIESIDEPVVHYLPRLRGTSYENATIKNVLQMASGVAWNEDYQDPKSDVAMAGGSNGLQLVQYLASLPNESQPGEKFNYNTGETNLAGEILRAAVGNNAATYLENKIWVPFGMSNDAYWNLGEPGGGELGGCCLNATLRDYARLGLFALSGGVLPSGERVLPEGWIEESTTPSKGYPGYGYLWWLQQEGYSARGIFGQYIRVFPDQGLIVAMHSNSGIAVDPEFGTHQQAVAEAFRDYFGQG